jgi:hypothetical protein
MFKHLIFLLLFYYTSISVFSQKKGNNVSGIGKELLITEKKSREIDQIPIVSFLGKGGGYILLDSVKTAKSFFISLPYTLKSASVYFGAVGFSNPVMATINSTSLAGISELLSRCQEGTKIAFINIKIMKGNKISSSPDMIFTIKNKL